MANHGGGSRSGTNRSSKAITRAVCFDETNGDDALFTAEITDVLDNSHDVDVIGYDACLMGSVEVAYQYRPNGSEFSAEYMIASPATEWGYGWPYDKILGRLKTGGGNNGTPDYINGGSEAYLDPSTMTMADFTRMVVEEQYDATISEDDQTLSAYDLSYIASVKSEMDELAVLIDSEDERSDFEDVRGWNENDTAIHYFYANAFPVGSYPWGEWEWPDTPFFDLYDIAKHVDGNSNFSSAIQSAAGDVKTAVDNLVIASFGNSKYKNKNSNNLFEKNKHGIHIVFPKDSFWVDIDEDEEVDAASEYVYTLQGLGWYTPIDLIAEGADPYGKIDFCTGGTAGNGAVENWFELIDKWCDNPLANANDSYNYYNY
jgi:clostripain